MMRYGLLGVVLVGLVAAITFAAPAPAGAPAGRMGMGMGMGGMRRPMMNRMGMMGDVAVAGGNVYVICGGKLVKLDSDLKEVASIDLPHPRMMGGRMGGMMEQPGSASKQDPAPAMAGDMGMPAGMGRMIDALARVDADASGVYVLMAGKVTMYDTNLKKVKSADVAPKPEQPK